MSRQRRERFRMRRFCFGGAPQALPEGMPYSLVMGACIRLDFQRGNRAQGMVCTRGRAQQQQQPRTLQIWESGQLAEQPLFFLEAPSLDEILVAYGRAKHHDTALFGAQVASPHFVSELGYASRWGPIPGSSRPCLAQIRPDTTVIRDGLDSHVQRRPCPRGHRGDVKVVKESYQAVVRVEACCRTVQGIMLAQSEQRGGQRVALLAALALLVPPAVRGGSTTEHAHEKAATRAPLLAAW